MLTAMFCCKANILWPGHLLQPNKDNSSKEECCQKEKLCCLSFHLPCSRVQLLGTLFFCWAPLQKPKPTNYPDCHYAMQQQVSASAPPVLQ